MKFIPVVVAFLFVILQPILGWDVIPRYFDYSKASAITLGIFDGIVMVAGIGVSMWLLI
jgi:hypothetical protein